MSGAQHDGLSLLAVHSVPTRSAFLDGYSLHADRLVDAEDRDGLERLCRYGARSPIANSRLARDPSGRVVMGLRVGTTMLSDTSGLLELGSRDTALDGFIDELRVSQSYRGPDWVFAQYLSMSGTFARVVPGGTI